MCDFINLINFRFTLLWHNKQLDLYTDMIKIISAIGLKMLKKILILSFVSFTLTACSTQQVIGTGVAVARIPTKAAGAVAGTAGGIVGATVGGVVAGRTGAKYGKIAGQRAARKAIP